MRILITGAKGQLGSEIINCIEKGNTDIGEINENYKYAHVFGASKEELDITSMENVTKILDYYNPTIVINSAAYTKVDACEANRNIAFNINAIGPKNLAQACKKIGAKLIQISTDYVFKGDSLRPYREYDLPAPINNYGKTKYLGEEHIKEYSSKYFIVRTSWLYGYWGNNFVKSIIKLAKEKGYLEIVDDQLGTPTNAEDLTHHILEIGLTDKYGTYHCGGKGICSWYDFGCKIVELANIDCNVVPIKSHQKKYRAERPNYSPLDNMMLRYTIDDKMRHWEEALKSFINKYYFKNY